MGLVLEKKKCNQVNVPREEHIDKKVSFILEAFLCGCIFLLGMEPVCPAVSLLGFLEWPLSLPWVMSGTNE